MFHLFVAQNINIFITLMKQTILSGSAKMCRKEVEALFLVFVYQNGLAVSV